MGVEPVELFGVELGGGRGDVVEVEPLHQLRAAEDLVVAVAPAEAGQVVDDGLGQVAVVVVLGDAHRAVALGELLAVVAEDHRQVGVLRHHGAEGLQDVDLARGVVHVVVAADDLGDAHVPVVHHTQKL
jgi:hypothetical protein